MGGGLGELGGDNVVVREAVSEKDKKHDTKEAVGSDNDGRGRGKEEGRVKGGDGF